MRAGQCAVDGVGTPLLCPPFSFFGGDTMNESFAFHGYSMNNQIMCIINGDDICQIDYMTGQQKPIGKTSSSYSELEQTTTEYYNKLVELGVIVPPKDPQEAMAEMQKTMQDMATLIQSLSNEVKELKNGELKSNHVSSEQNVPEHKPERRSTKSAGSDAGNA